ncbi:MAG: alanyl-tRNA editing protein [Anaerolineae bacterium]|nr:alanyl-tRNA editing protein [Anaerolineae bacterium]
MNTERLYYQDAYCREFTARVMAQREVNGRPAVALDRTAFYPTGGGQPHDTGTLNGVPVTDVFAEDGAVWHVLEGDLPDGEVAGVLDWARRFDHMQQHTGQHVLSQAFVVCCHAETVAFHLGAAASTIDLNRTDLDADALAAVEAMANAVIDDARPVTATFVTPEELARLPLRKPPKVNEAIRIVQVAGFDWSACGGTHVADSAQIGLIKIVGTERRGSELRVSFLCGRRARADYGRLQALASGLAARFTCSQNEVPAAVERLIREQQGTRKALEELEAQWADATAAAWWAESTPGVGYRIIARALDAPLERVKALAQALRARPGTVALLAARGERPQLLFTRSDDLALHMGELMRAAAAAAGGRGGGRPDWAQGGTPTNDGLATALAAATNALMGK